MHNVSTKQRLAALRRRLGIFTGWQPRWVKERSRRLARLALSPGGGAAGVPVTAPGPDPEAGTTLGRETAGRRSYAPAAVALADATATEIDPVPSMRGRQAAGAARAPAAFAVAEAAPTEIVPAPPEEEESVLPPQATTEIAQAPTAALAVSSTRTDIAVAPAFRRSRPGRRALTVALVLAAIGAGIFALARRAQAPEAIAAVPPAAAPGRDVVPAAAAMPSSQRDPSSAPAASTLEVRPGDTLWHLAAAHLGDPMRWPELHAANAREIHDPDLIFPGQQLQLPRAVRL